MAINLPGKGSKEEAVKDNRTKLLCTELIREQGEVSSQQVEEDVAEGHVIIGLHCAGRAENTVCTLSLFLPLVLVLLAETEPALATIFFPSKKTMGKNS